MFRWLAMNGSALRVRLASVFVVVLGVTVLWFIDVIDEETIKVTCPW